MGIVAGQFEVLVLELMDVLDGGVEAHLREGAGVAGELLAGLVEVVRVEVEIAKGVDEIAGAQSAHLRYHQREERVTGDIERDAEEEIGAALVKLAAQLSLAHVKLEKGVAGRKGHFFDLSHVPGADDEAAAVGVFADLGDDLVDLVDGAAIGGFPGAPLGAVNGAEIALGVGPLVPDGNAVLLEPADIGIAAEEPEELVDDGFQVEFLGRQEGKGVAEAEAGLGAEDGIGAGAGAVGLESTPV